MYEFLEKIAYFIGFAVLLSSAANIILASKIKHKDGIEPDERKD